MNDMTSVYTHDPAKRLNHSGLTSMPIGVAPGSKAASASAPASSLPIPLLLLWGVPLLLLPRLAIPLKAIVHVRIEIGGVHGTALFALPLLLY